MVGQMNEWANYWLIWSVYRIENNNATYIIKADEDKSASKKKNKNKLDAPKMHREILLENMVDICPI